MSSPSSTPGNRSVQPGVDRRIVEAARRHVEHVLQPHHGAIEAGALVVLYGLYELTRGAVDGNWPIAQRNADAIVDFERNLGMFWEWDVQQWAQALPAVPALLGGAYVVLHLVGTIGAARLGASIPPVALRALPDGRRRRECAGARRLHALPDRAPAAGGTRLHGHRDAAHRRNLNSALLGQLYNPVAAVPSLHFGYALIVGVAVALLAERRTVRILGAVYPLVMLFVIVATGNHFWLDALAGAGVTLAAWAVARALLSEPSTRRVPSPASQEGS